ncbi:hypothetical protein C9374_004686 [Naegleria lovaniensis]|uniref:DUF4116 domain-containing protein n=1 Tax=Naegleria lovaniensis TaxID=51637 RepID=A0AA88GQK5_NAELO|nr:uncharacterized protein C9374_004686 [Naegleria lovaniensis]KAG2383349.1 hypothetical protein C9374_004686 [Naegleria lovaniensis]
MKRQNSLSRQETASESFKKLTDTDEAVRIMLIDFHPHGFHTLEFPNLFELLIRKFDNQSKGFRRWLKAKEEWLEQDGEMKIEFLNVPECVMKSCLHHTNLPLSVKRMTQPIKIAKLCETHRESIESVEFWQPFKIGILRLIKMEQFQILKYVPKEILWEWQEELSEILEETYELSFLFDLDDIDEAKRSLSEYCCYLFQLSERLRDHEEIVKLAIHLDNSSMQYASERLKNDRTFCMEVVRSNPHVFPDLTQELQNDKEFILELLSSSTHTLNGHVQQDMIPTLIPEVYRWIPEHVRYEIPMTVKMRVYEQLFLKDEAIDQENIMKGVLKSILQMLHDLPYEHFRVHKNYQHSLQEQGWFAHSLAEKCKTIVTYESEDYEFVILFAQVMTRLYMHYDLRDVEHDEEFISKRVDLPLMMKYAQVGLRHDRNFVLKAVKANGSVFKVISKFRDDKEVVLAALKSNDIRFTSDIPQHFHNDKDCMLAAMEHADHSDYLFFNLILRFFERKDRDVIIAAVKISGNYLQHLSDDFKNDRELLLIAISHNHLLHALDFASYELKQDAHFILDCVKQCCTFIDYCIEKKTILNSEIISEHVKRWGTVTDKLLIYFGIRDVKGTTFEEAKRVFQFLNQHRFDFEYFGSHIPESYLLKEPIQLVQLERTEPYIWQLCAHDAYNMWHEFLFENASWEIFFQ